MKLSPKARARLQGQPLKGLAKFKEGDKRLHPKAIASELRRRINKAKAEHPKIVKHAAKRASRVLK
jgi:hypothetical protein